MQRRRVFRAALLLPLLVPWPAGALAQETTPEEDADLAALVALLNTPVVSASKTAQEITRAPAKIVVITAEQIRQRGYLGIDEIFDDLAGMDIIHGRGVEFETVFMRGVRTENSDHFLLIWDGVIQNDTWKNNVWISRQYPLLNIDRIEVMYGPSSLLYGANAFGGIVNVILKKPRDVDGIAAVATLGDNATRLGEVNFGKERGNWRFSGNARWFESDEADVNDKSWTDAGGRRRYYNWVLSRDGASDASTPSGYAPGLNVVNGVPHWNYQGTLVPFDGTQSGETRDWMVQAGVGYKGFDLQAFTWYKREIEDGWYVPLRRMHGPWTPTGSAVYLNHRVLLGSTFGLQSYVLTRQAGIDADWSYDASFSRNITNNRNDPNNLTTSSFGVFPPAYYKLSNREWRAGQQLNHSAGTLEAVVGWEYTMSRNYEDYNLRSYSSQLGDWGEWAYTPQHDERNIAAFANAQVLATEKFSLAGGFRYDYNYLAGERGGFGHLYTGRLAGILNLGEKHQLKLIYGQAFQAPSPWQKFATVANERDLQNPTLAPERLSSTELVYENRPLPQWRNSLSIYFNQLSDLIALVAVPFGNGTTLQNQNRGGLEIFGQEIESRYFFDSRNSVWANATVSRTRVKETGERQGDLARYKANAGADLLLASKWSVSPRVHWVGARDTINQHSPNIFVARRAPSYVEADLTIAYLGLVEGLDLRLTARNLFDETWYDPGARTGDGRTYNSLIVQPGRTATIGILYRR
jgi:iron complex outermembrane receptor protein